MIKGIKIPSNPMVIVAGLGAVVIGWILISPSSAGKTLGAGAVNFVAGVATGAVNAAGDVVAPVTELMGNAAESAVKNLNDVLVDSEVNPANDADLSDGTSLADIWGTIFSYNGME